MYIYKCIIYNYIYKSRILRGFAENQSIEITRYEKMSKIGGMRECQKTLNSHKSLKILYLKSIVIGMMCVLSQSSNTVAVFY